MCCTIQKLSTCSDFAAINHHTGAMGHLLKNSGPIFRQDHKNSRGGEGQDPDEVCLSLIENFNDAQIQGIKNVTKWRGSYSFSLRQWERAL